MGKILSISLKLNFTPNTMGCYGLSGGEIFAGLLTAFLQNHTFGKRHTTILLKRTEYRSL